MLEINNRVLNGDNRLSASHWLERDILRPTVDEFRRVGGNVAWRDYDEFHPAYGIGYHSDPKELGKLYYVALGI